MKRVTIFLLFLSLFLSAFNFSYHINKNSAIPYLMASKHDNLRERNGKQDFSRSRLSEEEPSKSAYLISVHGVIDLGISSYVSRIAEDAREQETGLVILDIDTFGGRIDAANEICAAIAELAPIPTVAFVSGEAWSAGALISLTCKTIVMTPGSSIGSAEPRAGAMSSEELTDEKMVSAIRAKFKAVAEQNGHSVALAEAMVDKDVVLRVVKTRKGVEILTEQEWATKSERYKKKNKSKVLVAEGKLLNLTATEAVELGLAKAIVTNTEEVLKMSDLPHAEIREGKLTWSEVLVRFITHPIISSFLLSIGFLGLLFELRIPGWGVSGTIGLISLALFFWGHYLVGLANWPEMIVFLLGVSLLAVEIFVIPGFGVAGIMGIVLIVISLFLALIKHPFQIPQRELKGAFYIISYSFFTSLAIAFIGLRYLSKSKLWNKVVLEQEELAGIGYRQTKEWDKFLGREGKTITPLHPAGKVAIGDRVLDVVTEGEFIGEGTGVKVVDVSGSKIVVSKIC